MITLTKRARIQNYKKMIEDGRGTGIGSKYIPWLRIQDVASLGRSTRLKGIKTGRQQDFLSDMERDHFYVLEYSDGIVDIREQFPLLPLEETILIANELGINHPKNPETGEFIVMTTDFLLTIVGKDKMLERARTIKAKDDLLDKRIIEKFEIERVYWSKKGIDWGIVTEEEIDKVIAHNISYVHGYKDISNLDCFINIETNEIKDLVYEFIKRIVDDERSMRAICSEFDNEMLLEKGSGLSIFKYLVINKIIEIDIKRRINVNKNIPIIKVSEEGVRKVEVI